MGCRVARSRFTVVSKVSGHVSMGPTGVLLQSKRRVSSAISPSPKMRGGLLCRGFLAVEPDLDMVDRDQQKGWRTRHILLLLEGIREIRAVLPEHWVIS